MTPALQTFLGVLVPVLGVVTTVTVAFLARSQAREARVIADLRADVVVLKTERDESLVRERLLSDYVHKLRDHIANDKGAPPPPWPDGLTSA